jgi:hypothetical protein
MNLKRLAMRLGLVVALAAMMGGCCVLPFGHGGHGGHRDYRDYRDSGAPRHDTHRPG